ncbi:leucine-rich repeat-containing protein 3 [Platysternon megacephalum]|uniref:Leucine-rich repeat-containing protein 3 n=1 Tax=Platysternon megacephalum TaxID=55544 RepID=A0A4D9EMJ3_9SAUR|nr:leucine-rich repeat-containing protein 3 [Platysternon megacephalum]
MATEAEVTDAYYPLNVTNGTSTCILFYASNFSLTANKSVHADLTNLTFVSRKVDFSSSVCSDTNATLSLNYTGLVDGINNLKIRFLMTKKFYTGSARKWFTLDSVEIAHDNQTVARFNVSIISAPAEYSFHCQLVGTSSLYGAKLIPANSEAKNWDVYLSEFQIQGFNIHNNLFSYASDCTSFFSPGIWMGLVTSVVLLWILTYGIHMIMQLTTNSRFDDPKGQALTIHSTLEPATNMGRHERANSLELRFRKMKCLKEITGKELQDVAKRWFPTVLLRAHTCWDFTTSLRLSICLLFEYRFLTLDWMDISMDAGSVISMATDSDNKQDFTAGSNNSLQNGKCNSESYQGHYEVPLLNVLIAVALNIWILSLLINCVNFFSELIVALGAGPSGSRKAFLQQSQESVRLESLPGFKCRRTVESPSPRADGLLSLEGGQQRNLLRDSSMQPLEVSTRKLSHQLSAMKIFSQLWIYRRFLLILFTPLLLLPLPLIIRTKEAECAYTLFVVAIFWLTEALPLAVSALLPALMFPMFGIMASKEVAAAYFKDFHLLLIGVICLATSIEKWNLHKRIALKMVMIVGVNPAWYVLNTTLENGNAHGKLGTTEIIAYRGSGRRAIPQAILKPGGLQQFRSPPAPPSPHEKVLSSGGSSSLTLSPIQLMPNSHMPTANYQTQALCAELSAPLSSSLHPSPALAYRNHSSFPDRRDYKATEQNLPPAETGRKYRNQKDQMMCKVMCLCIAYSSTIGGLTTITGTSTNLIFAEQFNTRYPDCQCINFGSWFILCIPITIIIMLLSWVWLQWLFLGFNFKEMFRCGKEKTVREQASAQVIKEEYTKLGPISYPEIITLVLFILMALLWFTREPGFIPGWSSLFPQYPGFATDSTAALIIGLLFFIIPAKTLSRTSNGENTIFDYTPLITWKEFQSCMPWEITILVGGGFALAEGCEVSKLSVWIGSKLTPLGSLPIWLIILISSLIVTSVTEVASNPATITIFLPILAPLAEAIHVNPLYILIPTTLCTSFAFLLPVANPPNAIVFSYGHLNVIDMVKAGLGVNIIGVAVVMLAVTTWAVPLFDLQTYPSWARDLSTVNNTGP